VTVVAWEYETLWREAVGRRDGETRTAVNKGTSWQ
jgi:hypothetical protein